MRLESQTEALKSMMKEFEFYSKYNSYWRAQWGVLWRVFKTILAAVWRMDLEGKSVWGSWLEMTVSWSRMWSLEMGKGSNRRWSDSCPPCMFFEARQDLFMWEVSKNEKSRMTPRCSISSARWMAGPVWRREVKSSVVSHYH